MKINVDNPFIVILGKIADLVVINFLTMFLCVPVITAGAALTAQYYVCLKLLRDEDSHVYRMYFKSFKENFKQSTILWLIMIGIVAVPTFMLELLKQNFGDALPSYATIAVGGAILLAVFCLIMVLPVQSRFGNTIGNTIKMGLYLSVSNPFRTFLIIIITISPFLLVYLIYQAFPFVLFFGFSLPSFLSVCLYNKAFKKLEEKANEQLGVAEPGAEDEHIFSDEPILENEEEVQ